MKNIKIAVIALCTVAAAVVYLNASSPAPAPGATIGMVETVDKATKGMAVNFTWKDGSTTNSFAEYTKGKVVLLNFWATWCGPCKREIPDLIEISKEMAAKGVIIFGVSLDQGDKRMTVVKNYVEKVNIPYINVVDNNNFTLTDAYGGISAIPTTLIIDKNGKIVDKIVGGMTKEQFEAALNKALQ